MKKLQVWAALWVFGFGTVSLLEAAVFDQIRIQVYNQVITQREIDLRTEAKLSAQNGRGMVADPLAQETVRAEVTESLVEEALLSHRAEELKIEISEEQLDEEMDRFRSQNRMNEREFEEALEQQKTTLSDFREALRAKLARDGVMQREIASQVAINEEEIKKNYLAQAQTSLMVHARHILILAKPNAPEGEVKKAKEKLEGLRKQLISGEDFGKLAQEFSQDPTVATNLGDLGFFKKEDMDPGFTQAAFALAPGTISVPVRTKFGLHLIEVLSKEERPLVPFEKVRDSLFSRAFNKEYQEKMEAYLKQLKANAKINYR
ncbi:MAG: hypothetical protein A2600_07300 [Candidatus Lambdaproteobacteria bacterium RIFOXYD1_FULL_56_27]|uniref:PpiC domain-containing protein n=1 Tax=Candidatus Lambdaproteobacteria bacterium RIFOXYD2_FULL_56_26 TaxID=1817773 RepID=A0A1F6GQ90_9PROT|nr:MAG: hypothetical protein A2557_05960 [Candidatus Lambdaproteobacteria bacterium RIFOXYD2_FULL_56_26]OGH03737.1 MAG: hypothetical protein A2426_00750 [Candidatus Lambdaproteobacteria bacterium RIFOXYC1_FULL_56_13]OGH07321.1 MAG: hypothetical protein A2600_07300 [Candidatus Lambdaproteobacteria bacterium RIFOXYD1_FULL_56_27]